MNIIARRIVTGFVLAAAPAVIAVGAAAGSQAETTAMADTMATEHRPAAIPDDATVSLGYSVKDMPQR